RPLARVSETARTTACYSHHRSTRVRWGGSSRRIEVVALWAADERKTASATLRATRDEYPSGRRSCADAEGDGERGPRTRRPSIGPHVILMKRPDGYGGRTVHSGERCTDGALRAQHRRSGGRANEHRDRRHGTPGRRALGRGTGARGPRYLRAVRQRG